MAKSLNKIMLIGRLGQDPKLAYMPSGQAVAEMSVATDESYRDKQTGENVERTEWHRVKVFGKTAEFCANYLGKGRLVYVEGSIRTRKYQDKQGQDRWITEVLVDQFRGRVDALDRAQPSEDGQGFEDRPPRQQPPRQQQPRPQARQQQPQPGGYDDEDLGPAFPSEASGMDDVPF